MTRNIVKIDRETVICELEGLFISHRISAAPLVDKEGKLAGFVTKSDINRFHFTEGDPFYTRAWEIATPIVVKINADASIKEAANLMIEKHLHHLLVINPDNQDISNNLDNPETMAGMVSSFDFIKLVAGKH
jgi:CBS domain-containing protein